MKTLSTIVTLTIPLIIGCYNPTISTEYERERQKGNCIQEQYLKNEKDICHFAYNSFCRIEEDKELCKAYGDS